MLLAADVGNTNVVFALFEAREIKGKLGHFDWHLPNLGQMSLTNGNGAKLWDQDEAGWEKIKETTMSLRPQVGGFFDYGGTFSSLNDGQMLAFCGIGDWITGVLEKSGAKVKSVIPEQGGLQWSECFSIGKGSTKADLAKKWIQYITSAKGQVKSVNMAAYPAMVPNQKGWEVLQAGPDEWRIRISRRPAGKSCCGCCSGGWTRSLADSEAAPTALAATSPTPSCATCSVRGRS